MIISRLNQVWLADITYIRIMTGFVYLAAVLDACSRRVIGYAILRMFRASHCRLNMFQQCPRQYRFHYIDDQITAKV